MNVVLLLLDSLNRKYLDCYGDKITKTPNIDRLVEKSVVFENHFVGSLPCIPARRDLMTGRFEFMFRGWGQTEPFDKLLVHEARKLGADTAIITDHYHYWNGNDGYGYSQGYQYTDYIRGTEADAAGYKIRKTDKVLDSLGEYRYPFEIELFGRNKQNYKNEEDFMAPRVFKSAVDYLKHNHDLEKFFLHIEEFSPHEPFIVPDEFKNLYGEYREDLSIWPPYQSFEQAKKFIANHKEGEVEFIRQQYRAGITYVDKYIGQILDLFDEYDLWKNTALILTTDHGHDLYEHEQYGKSYPYYLNSSHIPLIFYHPEVKPGREEIITQNVDMYSTILDILGKEDSDAYDGKSILKMLKNKEEQHESAIFGTFSRGVGYADKQFIYISDYDPNMPVYWFSTHPKIGGVGCDTVSSDFADATSGKYIPEVDMPVWKIKMGVDKERKHQEMLFDRINDPDQLHNLASEKPELVKKYRALLLKRLNDMKAPQENIDRLMLNK